MHVLSLMRVFFFTMGSLIIKMVTKEGSRKEEGKGGGLMQVML